MHMLQPRRRPGDPFHFLCRKDSDPNFHEEPFCFPNRPRSLSPTHTRVQCLLKGRKPVEAVPRVVDEANALGFESPGWPFLRRGSDDATFTARSGEMRSGICGSAVDDEGVEAVLMEGFERGVEVIWREGFVYSLDGGGDDGGNGDEDDEGNKEDEDKEERMEEEVRGQDEEVGDEKEGDREQRPRRHGKRCGIVGSIANDWQHLVDGWSDDNTENTPSKGNTSASSEVETRKNSPSSNGAERTPLMTMVEFLRQGESDEVAAGASSTEAQPESLLKEMSKEAMEEGVERTREMPYAQGTIEWEMARKKRMEARLLPHPALVSKVFPKETPKEITTEVSHRHISGDSLLISLLPVHPLIHRSRPYYMLPGQRPVHSLPPIPEDQPCNPIVHENEKQLRYLRSITASMETLAPPSGLSEPSTTVIDVDETIEEAVKAVNKTSKISVLVKAVRGKLAAVKVLDKEIKGRREKNAQSSSLGISSSTITITEAVQEQAAAELSDIQEIIKECKLYITGTLHIANEKIQETSAQTKAVLEAVEQHKLEGTFFPPVPSIGSASIRFFLSPIQWERAKNKHTAYASQTISQEHH